MAAEAPLVELVERSDELERLGAALRQAANGQGAFVAIEGTPGLGKSALLDALAARATARGFGVHRARGVEFERALAYGVARQLFRRPIEPELLEAVPAPARQVVDGSALPSDPEPADPFAVLHGLSSLCAALAEAKPILLVVDDAQWADDASLRFIAFLRERLDGLPALVALGLRSPGHGERSGHAAQLAGDPRTIRIEPAPLSVAATRELLGRHVDDPPAALCRASHEATGGNPFYLHSLAEELRRGGGGLDGKNVAGLAPEAVTRAVLGRLARLGPDAVAVAQAVAIFGGEAEVRAVAAFTGLAGERVTLLADALAEAGVLADGRPLTFVHAIVRSAVEADLPSGRRSVAGRRAAQVLIEAGAPAERVALQLLSTEPGGEPWVVEALERGAATAAGPGARETAVALLRRALDEPPPPEHRPGLLAALGTAERHAMAPEAPERLASALAVVRDADARAELAVELAAAREQLGQAGEALELLEQALAHHDARAGGLTSPQGALLEAQIHAVRLVALLPLPDEDRARGRARLAQAPPGIVETRHLAGVLAYDEAARGGTAKRALELARLALEPPLPPEALATVLPMVAMVGATCAGAPEIVLRNVDLGALARVTGSPWAAAAAGTWRALAGHRAGALADAEADGSGAVEGFANLPIGRLAATGVLADVLLDRRGPDAAAAALRQAGPLNGTDGAIQRMFHDLGAAHVALARSAPAEAAALARRVGERLTTAGLRSTQVLPWRLTLARAELACGDVDTARAHAVDALEKAEQFGERHYVAAALTTLGLAQDGDAERRDTLRAAVDAAAGASPLAVARAQLALGSAMRRAGRRADARAPLREALDLAERCGADAVARTAREELEATGERVRSRIAARSELTASELRVVRLAADGLSNRDIAQALFVTVKTVETHLYSAFRKLDVKSRRELATALGGIVG